MGQLCSCCKATSRQSRDFGLLAATSHKHRTEPKVQVLHLDSQDVPKEFRRRFPVAMEVAAEKAEVAEAVVKAKASRLVFDCLENSCVFLSEQHERHTSGRLPLGFQNILAALLLHPI